MPSDRTKAPAWLSLAGSPRATSGVQAARTRRASKKTSTTPKTRPRTAAASTEEAGLSDNARVVLEGRYLARDADGAVMETAEGLFRRVARNIAEAEANFGSAGTAEKRVREAEAAFYGLMASLRFLPNSPTLGNAGRPIQQLAACFVLPVEDSMEGIFDSLKDTALIHQSGGGTGFAFSRLRPAGDIVSSTGGIASGPVSFMRVYDAATESIKQGGTRRGANMAILSVEHPDIEAFIDVKSDMTALQNFNISVAVTERFMEAVERDDEYALLNPRTGEERGRRRARDIFKCIVANAWQNGDPGIVFLDRINRDNPTPLLGRIEATNPCGEQPLLPYESCNLGSLNLLKFVRETARTRARSRNGANGVRSKPAVEIDWDALAAAIPVAVRFLDNVIEQNKYPIPEIEAMTKQTRKIGLGVMGWADLLFALRIRYDSEEAIDLAGQVASFIQQHADAASEALAKERGTFPAWPGSVYDPAAGDPRGGHRYRNSTRTTIAPTGTLSIIADCSGGIEPAFALAFMRQHFLDRDNPSQVTQLPEVNRTFASVAREEGFGSDELMTFLAEGGELGEREDVPQWAKNIFRTSHDIAPEWHVRMQAAFQRHTDNAVSKTINFRHDSTVDDIERAYMLAYREGCKGITVYRDGSRHLQVLSHATARGPEQAEAAAAEFALGLETVLSGHPAPTGSTAPRPPGAPYRRHLPDERRSLTHKFRVGEQEGYLTVGLYDDGTPGEIFVNISKEGSTIRGLMDSVALLTSVALQYGVPLRNLVDKFRGVHFEPAGLTGNGDVPTASSLVDYIFRWLEARFIAGSATPSADQRPSTVPEKNAATAAQTPASATTATSTGMGCPKCGSILVFAEGCFLCRSCGFSRC